MKRGIQLEIPNEWGNYLGELLEPFNINHFDWYIGGEEAYQDNEGKIEPLFQGEIFGMMGQDLSEILKSKVYYVIFANFKAYLQGESIEDVVTYEEFLESRKCQLVVLVVDSSYVTVYCKDTEILNNLYQNAIEKGFENVQYVTDENDTRTKLSVW